LGTAPFRDEIYQKH